MKTRVEEFWACYWSERNQNFILLYPGSWDVEKHGQPGGILGGDGNWTRLRLREVMDSEQPGPYWAWEDFKRGNAWTMPQSSFVKLQICFAYGIEVEEEYGNGRRVNLTPV